MAKPFKSINTNRPPRSVFDLSYSKLLTCDMGQLIPVMHDEVVPGDKFKIGNEIVIRFQPLVAPILHEINVYVHYFFVPYRLLWDKWEDFITGGVDGDNADVLPRWNWKGTHEQTDTSVGSLWNHFGFPTKYCDGVWPLDFPRRAYNLVYNEYYRDETLQDELDITDLDNFHLLNRSWEKDYFTSALPFQQRGTAPALPISGVSSAEWSNGWDLNTYQAGDSSAVQASHAASSPPDTVITLGNGTTGPSGPANLVARLLGTDLNNNTVDLTGLSTFDVADLRLAFQVQRWMERNARAGVRYTEFLRSHFGVSPRDERLQRPEYIGGSRAPVIVSEVLQTSQTDDTPQGTMAGHGISASSQFCGSYQATEYGMILGIMSVMPKPMYYQGINRQWLRRSRYDFYFPEFANLSEQAIEKGEIFVEDGDATANVSLFGYQGRYDEMRYKPNMVTGQMQTTFNYWHLARSFAGQPSLNEAFIKCIPDKRVFADQVTPGLLVSFGNIIKAIRPLPIASEPGLIDHN